MSTREKVVIDTNVYIDYLREGRHPEWVLGRADGNVRFLSAVVLFELKVGASTLRSRRAVEALATAFPPQRHLAPSVAMYGRAASLFRQLHGSTRPPHRGDRLGLLNDILIALTAWSMGGIVVTSNERDFARISARLSGFRFVAP